MKGSGRGRERDFAEAVAREVSAFGEVLSSRFGLHMGGEPEDKLRGPLEGLLSSVGKAMGLDVVPAGEAGIAALGIRPDYAIHVDGALCGHVEVKAPGKGADPDRFKGHDRRQWESMKFLPNLLYTDGNSWALFRQGLRVGEIVVLKGDVQTSGKRLATGSDGLARLLNDFLRWEPNPPASAEELAQTTAGLCRLLRDEVLDVLGREKSLHKGEPRPFTDLANEWRELLFPGASDAVFADSYGQTVTFAFLLARAEGISITDVQTAATRLGKHHGLLGTALQVLTGANAFSQVRTSVEVLQRVIGAVDWKRLSLAHDEAGPKQRIGEADNPWLYFYEGFLAAYDPKLREEEGAYYTPPAVVGAQVRLVENLLQTRLGKGLGLAHDGVVTIDPAMGTGSYLLRVIEKAAQCVKAREGAGAVEGRLGSLAKRLIGFENMIGAYSVAELQVSAALRRHGVEAPSDGLRLHLTDTLANPYVEEHSLGGFYEPIARSRREANKVKKEEPVLVCLGNPPYDRHDVRKQVGGWVRDGDPGKVPILDDFRARDIQPGHLTNLYNLYVYFWRWALWKVFEIHPDSPHGVVAFITSSSFINGPGFAEMRAHMRRVADEIWVIDLGGEGRGARKEENVFAIQTPVAITICLREGLGNSRKPAKVNYARISGNRRSKLKALRKVRGIDDLTWGNAPKGWREPFLAVAKGAWATFPLLFDLVPWVSPGVQVRRTWPIGPSPEVLEGRWRRLARAPAEERTVLFKEDVHLNITSTPGPLPGRARPKPTSIRTLRPDTPCPKVERYGYRSFDRQWLIADRRLITTPSPELWTSYGASQVFLTTQKRFPLGNGAGLSATASLPDYHHFQGSFGGAVLPLWKDSSGRVPNLAPHLLRTLSTQYGQKVTAPDFFAYVACVVAHSGYTERFRDDLATPGPRIPLTRDASVFRSAVDVGSKVLWHHTYGQRFFENKSGRPRNQVPQGSARVKTPIPGNEAGMPENFSHDSRTDVLSVGTGAISGVTTAVAQYEVSGMRVLNKWLGYRLKEPKGKHSSPLEEITATTWPAAFTTELLELLWTIEHLVALETEQSRILGAIAGGALIPIADLERAGVFPVPPDARKPLGKVSGGLFDSEE